MNGLGSVRYVSPDRVLFCEVEKDVVTVGVEDTFRYSDMSVYAIEQALSDLLIQPINQVLVSTYQNRFPESRDLSREWIDILANCRDDARQLDCIGLSSNGIIELNIVIGGRLNVDIDESIQDLGIESQCLAINSAIVDLSVDYRSQLHEIEKRRFPRY